MTEEKKRLYFHTSMGYIGILLMMVACLRFLLNSDPTGNFIGLLAVLCLSSYMRYVETKLPFTPKEKRIYKGANS